MIHSLVKIFQSVITHKTLKRIIILVKQICGKMDVHSYGYRLTDHVVNSSPVQIYWWANCQVARLALVLGGYNQHCITSVVLSDICQWRVGQRTSWLYSIRGFTIIVQTHLQDQWARICHGVFCYSCKWHITDIKDKRYRLITYKAPQTANCNGARHHRQSRRAAHRP